jgi:hypothetical protein
MDLLERAKERPGQITKNECERLAWLASQVPADGLAVEIGAYKGKSTAAILAGLPRTARLVSIDPWCLQGETPQGYETIETIADYRESIALQKQQVTQIIGWPVQVAEFWNAPIDFLFVDAVKKYDAISPLWRAWLPYCRGWIASHDYLPDEGNAQNYPGVVRTIAEQCIPITADHHHIDYTWSGKIKGGIPPVEPRALNLLREIKREVAPQVFTKTIYTTLNDILKDAEERI